MEKGTISINAQNIMPVIKKWLYSDKDIFLRELVSNGCDAISKYKLIAMKGEAPAEEAPRVDVICDRENGTLQIVDNGIGMTADEIEKYICQVAFSGAEEFLKQYKPEEGANGGIIGHFGLGFYSAFMVASKVTIDSKSWREGTEAVRWTSEDGMTYDMAPSDRTERGTCITLQLSDEEKSFAELFEARKTLEKYCAFMPVPIYVSEAPKAEAPETAVAAEAPEASETSEKSETADSEAKSEGEAKKAEPVQVNDTHPLWLKMPNECTDEEYRAFYHKVFNDYEEPLFWIHLNAEYPFNLKGILYFPKIKNEFSASEGQVKLYSNQVFVADNIKEIIPEFLLLLKGAIDCPDLPLNVSRSFLQNDGYVKKLSAYITRKVADRLTSEFNTKRSDYEKYWDDIHPFVKYGAIKDDKFFERVKDVLLFKTTEGKYRTLEELKAECAQEDGSVTVMYTSDEKRQAQMIRLYTDQGKPVAVLNTLIDNNFVSFLEYSLHESKISFKRVDADTAGLTEDGETDLDREALTNCFRDATGDKELTVEVKPFKNANVIAMVTVDEQMRRFEDMSRMWGSKHDLNLPVKRSLTLNASHPVIRWIAAEGEGDKRTNVCRQVVDLAEMARQPLEADRMVEFLERSNSLLAMLVEK